MMKFSTLLVFALAFFAIKVGAQPFYNVSHTTGTVAIGGVNVTVTSSGAAGIYGGCAGHNYLLGSGQSAYTYSFNVPIAGFRVYSIGLDNGERMNFNLNGSGNAYNLQASNYTPYSTCGFSTPGVIVPGGFQNGTGILTVKEPLTSSFTISSNGTAGGSAYMLEIIPLTASASGTFCSGTPLNLFANLSGATYSWTGPNGFTSNSQNPTIASPTTAASGTYTVTSTNGLTTATQTVDVLIKQTVTPTVTVLPATTNVCSGGGTFVFNSNSTNGGAVPSYQWKVNATNVGTNSTTYVNSTGFTNGDVVSLTMTTSAACASTPTGSGSAIMNVTTSVTPSVAINISPVGNICAGSSVSFTAVPTNGGTTPSYQWKRNGVNVATGVTYNAGTGLVTGDVISCTMTSNAACIIGPAAVTSSTTMTIHPSGTPTVNIGIISGTTCAGSSVQFKVLSFTLGGNSPSFQWKKNGLNVGTGIFYTGSGLVTGDQITCELTNVAPCISPTTVSSNTITMTMNPVVTPSVTLAANPGFVVCAGTSVTFTPTPTNGGGAPTYQWFRNGVSVTTGATYTTSTYNNGDYFYAKMTSNALCATVTTANSNYIYMNSSAVLTPSVTINGPSPVCQGATITYTTTTVAPGNAPVYQWKINGNNVGTNSSSYTNAGTLVSGDVLSCTMTSNYSCATQSTATGTKVITVNPVPTITIVSDKGINVCPGGNVTFSSLITGAGASPTYQWKKNGVNVGTGVTYATTALAASDIIACVLTATGVCEANKIVLSNLLQMNVTPHHIAVTSSVGNLGCLNQPATFTATVISNTTPVYQWVKNGVNVGFNQPTYVDATLVSGDAIKCQLTNSLYCPAPANTPENTPIVMTVNQPVIPVVTVAAAPSGSICDGTMTTFNTVLVNGGLIPKYQWTLNGQDIASATSASYVSGNINDGDKVACKLQSSLTCALPVVSNEVVMDVIANKPHSVEIIGIPGPDGILFHSSVQNGGAGVTYQWMKNNVAVPGATQSTWLGVDLKPGDGISVKTHSSETCAVPETAVAFNKFVSQVTGVSSWEPGNELSLYPNPNSGTFTLKGKVNTKLSNNTATVMVVNTIGQVVYKKDVKVENGELNLNIDLGNNNAAGMYMVRIGLEGVTENISFIVK